MDYVQKESQSGKLLDDKEPGKGVSKRQDGLDQTRWCGNGVAERDMRSGNTRKCWKQGDFETMEAYKQEFIEFMLASLSKSPETLEKPWF